MRILLTADPFLPVPPLLYGGIERVIAQLLAELLQRGHQVGLLAHPQSSVESSQFFSWAQCAPSGLLGHGKNLRCLAGAVADFEPDLVHSFSRLAYLLGIGRRTTPALMCYQREPTGRTIAAASRLLGSRLRFSGCSEYIAERGRANAGSWHAVHNCVDVSAFSWNEQVPEDAPLVFLSRVESIKGAHLAIDMAEQSGRRLIIAGNHASEGPEHEYFTRQVQPRFGPRVEYVGAVNDQQKQQLLAGAAAMVVPIQWNEPFGIVFAESLASGTPVISCPRGALPEIVRHGQHGFLVDDLAGGVAAIDQLSSISRKACRQRARTAFDTSVIADQYLKIYQEMLA